MSVAACDVPCEAGGKPQTRTRSTTTAAPPDDTPASTAANRVAEAPTSRLGIDVFPLLLTATAGALDATTFIGLGSVFASVMTGNLVLLGLSAGKSDAGLAIASGIALAGYVAGTLVGAGIATRVGVAGGGRAEIGSARSEPLYDGGSGPGGGELNRQGTTDQPGVHASGPSGELSSGVVHALTVELLVIVGFAAFWESAAGHPSVDQQRGLLVMVAGAMGIQSAAVRHFGAAGFSTTYLTGTLTGVVSALAAPAHSRAIDLWAAGRLLSLVVGAAVAAVLVDQVPRAAPAVPLGAGLAALVLAWIEHHSGAPAK